MVGLPGRKVPKIVLGPDQSQGCFSVMLTTVESNHLLIILAGWSSIQLNGINTRRRVSFPVSAGPDYLRSRIERHIVLAGHLHRERRGECRACFGAGAWHQFYMLWGGGASQVHTVCQEMVVVCGLHVPAHSNYRGGTPGLS
jgi:hypothetical protein